MELACDVGGGGVAFLLIVQTIVHHLILLPKLVVLHCEDCMCAK